MGWKELYSALQEKKECLRRNVEVDLKLAKLRKTVNAPSQKERDAVKLQFIPTATWEVVEPIEFAHDDFLTPDEAKAKCFTFNRGNNRFIGFNSNRQMFHIIRLNNRDVAVTNFRIKLDASEIESIISLFRRISAVRRIQRFVRNVWFWNPTYRSGRSGLQARHGVSDTSRIISGI